MVVERIKLIFDVDKNAPVGSLGAIRKAVDQAEGSRGKFQAGLSSTTQYLKANMAEAATAAGAALVAFGVKGVKAFQDTALESGKFADATGTSVEEASRLREVAGDLGIEFGTVQGALQRFNRAAADGSVEVEGFGNTVVTAADGTVDAYQSFINAATAIGAIEDPTKRAEAAQATFGRSYGEIAELMEMDATSLRAALDGVSDAKVIDDDELRKARSFRDAMDRLNGVVEDLQLAVGELVVENADLLDSLAANLEMVVKYSNELSVAGRAAFALISPVQGVREAMDLASDEIVFASASLEDLNAWLDDHGATAEETAAAIDAWKSAQQDAAREAVGLADDVEAVDRSAQDFTEEMQRAKDATRDLEDAYKSLKGELDQREGWLNLEESLRQFRWDMAAGEMSIDEKRLALVNIQQELVDYLGSLENVPAEKQTDILALIDQGKIDEAEQALANLTRPRSVPISASTGGALPNVSTGLNGRRAGGGPVSAGGAYLVGENGPEVLQMGSQSGTVIPNHALGGGGQVTIHANITTTSDPRGVYESFMRGLRLYGAADLKRQLGL